MQLINSVLSFLSDTITFLVFFGIFYIIYHSLYQHYISRGNTENNKYANSSLELEELKESTLQAAQTFDIEKRIDDSINFENIDSPHEETLNNAFIITNNNESLPLVLEDIKTQQSQKSSPLPKLTLAGASTLIGVLVAGLLVSQGLNGTSKLQKFQQQTIPINNNLNKIKGTPPQSPAITTIVPKTVKRVVVPKVPTQTKTACSPKSNTIPHRL